MKIHPTRPRTRLLTLLALLAGAALAVPAAAQSPCGDQVTVTYGDTLFDIAQRCGTTVEALVTDNELIDDPDVLEVGWVLDVPRVDPVDEVPDGRGETPTAPPTAPPGRGAPGAGAGDVHVVEPGDTLAEIAALYEVPLATLVAANDIENPNLIHVGQRIALPDGEGRPPLPEPPAAARVAITPTAGAPGTAVTVTASGFPPGAQVHVGAGRAQSEYDVLERTEADAEGRVRATVELPRFADPREEWVFVVTTPDHRVRARSERFAVRPGDGGEGEEGDEGEEGLVTVRGTLTTEGVECPALRTAEGDLYTLTGDLGGFETGDVVEVVGRVAEVSICMQGTTLAVERIEAAAD